MKFYIEALEVFHDLGKVEVLVLINEIKTVKKFHTVVKMYPIDELKDIMDCSEQYPPYQHAEMEITRKNGRITRTFKPVTDKTREDLIYLFDKPNYFAGIDTKDLFGDFVE